MLHTGLPKQNVFLNSQRSCVPKQRSLPRTAVSLVILLPTRNFFLLGSETEGARSQDGGPRTCSKAGGGGRGGNGGGPGRNFLFLARSEAKTAGMQRWYSPGGDTPTPITTVESAQNRATENPGLRGAGLAKTADVKFNHRNLDRQVWFSHRKTIHSQYMCDLSRPGRRPCGVTRPPPSLPSGGPWTPRDARRWAAPCGCGPPSRASPL